MTNIAELLERNRQRWLNAQFKTDALALARKVAVRLVAPQAKSVYVKLQEVTGVPWFAIAMIHEREASQRWDRSIAQGDRFDIKSIHIPAGRGPFNSFVDAAVDALVKCPPYAARWKDWTPGGMLTLQELYNGLGYANGPIDTSVQPPKKYPPQPSAYIWSGTDQYTAGKYVRDRVFKPDVVDSQLGCAVMLKAMMDIDEGIYSAQPADNDASPAEIANESADHGDDINPDEYPDVRGGAAIAPVATASPPPPPVVAPAATSTDAVLLSTQSRLKAMNYNPGIPDGKWGGMTASAIGGFLNDRNAGVPAPTSVETFNAVHDQIKAELDRAEAAQFARPVSEARAAAAPALVAQVAPEVVPVKQNMLVTAWGAVAAFITAIWTTVSEQVSSAWHFFTDHKDSIPTDSGTLHNVWSYIGKVPISLWIVLGGLGLGFVAINSARAASKIKQSVQTGERQ